MAEKERPGETMTATDATRTPGVLSPGLDALTIYRYYRVVLAGALLLVFLVNLDRVGGDDPGPFLLIASSYFVAALLTSMLSNQLLQHELLQAGVLVAMDVLALSLLMHSTGGISSPITPLLVVSIAAGAILLPGKLSYVMASAGTLTMLYEQVYNALKTGAPLTHGSTQVGLLGLAFFGIVIATNQLTARLRHSEALADQRSKELQELELLNAHIIQRMRTGILVVDASNVVRLVNNAAKQMLAAEPWYAPQPLGPISAELLLRVEQWRDDNARRFEPFRNHVSGPEIDTHMTAVRMGEGNATLIFLDDMAMIAHQLQQMKLAALGRLTASIAHEIRNPLSAINHAAQLLAESELDKGDRRLTEIVQKQSLRLDRIVENVLQLSRRQAPRGDLLDLAAWLREFRADYLATHQPGDTLDIDVGDHAWRARFDAHHLYQILQNLCDNGLRHGRALNGSGHVQIILGTSGYDGEVPQMRIVDNGPGIPPDQIGNLFEPFFTTDAKGTGLGLYIARELCDANRARLAYVPARENEKGYFQITFAHPGRFAS